MVRETDVPWDPEKGAHEDEDKESRRMSMRRTIGIGE